MALASVADWLGAGLEHALQRHARVVGGAAHDEVLRGITPDLAQPLEIGLESPRCNDGRRRANRLQGPVGPNVHRIEVTTRETEIDDVGVVEHVDPQALGGGVVAVHQRLASTERRTDSSGQAAACRATRLKADAFLAIHSGQVSDCRIASRASVSSMAPPLTLRRSERNSSSRRCQSSTDPGSYEGNGSCACAGCCRHGSRTAPVRARPHERRCAVR